MLSELQSDCDALDKDVEFRVLRLNRKVEEMEKILSPRKESRGYVDYFDSERRVARSELVPELHSALEISRLEPKQTAASSSQLKNQLGVSGIIGQSAVQLQQLHDEKEHYKKAYEKLFVKSKADKIEELMLDLNKSSDFERRRQELEGILQSTLQEYEFFKTVEMSKGPLTKTDEDSIYGQEIDEVDHTRLVQTEKGKCTDFTCGKYPIISRDSRPAAIQSAQDARAATDSPDDRDDDGSGARPIKSGMEKPRSTIAASANAETGKCTDFTCGQYPTIFRDSGPAAAQSAQDARAVFDSMDVDGDGNLSLSELKIKLSEFGLDQGEIEKLFGLLDSNGDGLVDRAEFDAGFAKYKALEQGGVSARELLKVWAAEKSTQLTKRVTSVSRCPAAAQCCPAPAHRVGLLQDEPRRVVFVGCTGSGKSSLCTALTGQDRDKEAREASSFRIGKGAKSETMECTALECRWLGEESQDAFLCIDTPGLNDSEGGDEHHINDIISTMRRVEYVNAIVLVLNGTDPRFSKSLQDAMRKFEQAFCGDTPGKVHANFYDNLIICFQRWKRNKYAVQEREESNTTEQGTAHDFCKQLREKFPHVKNRAHDVPCLFVDSHDSDPRRKAQHLLLLKNHVPAEVFRTGNIEHIVPRLLGFDAAEQSLVQSSSIIPMKPRLVDASIKVTQWSISPPLPPGLVMCCETGVITGTPQSPCAPVSYTVVAESLGGKSKPCEIPNIEIKLSSAEIQSVVLTFKKDFEPLLLSALAGLGSNTNGDNLDTVIMELEKVIHDCVSKTSAELEQRFAKMSQLSELIEKVMLAGYELKTNHEIKLRQKFEKHVKAEHEARLKLEKLDHEVQRLLLTCTEDHPNLLRLINHLEALEPEEGSPAASTLHKARQWLGDIEPTPCTYKGCPHVGLRRNQNRHAESCLFNLPLITKSAVLQSAPDDCSRGFELTATIPEYEEYCGSFEPGPSQHMDDDEEGWFHRLDFSRNRIIRIKNQSERWVLACWEGPEDERIVMHGSDSPVVDKANFEGFTITPTQRLTWAENPAPGSLVEQSIKLIYFGGMWCPFCPPFTKKLKNFFDIVREAFGKEVIEVIFASSDRSEGKMLEYYGRHHGDWFALPYSERGKEQFLNKKFDVNGIPSLHVIGNDSEEVAYFKDLEKGGKLDIGDEIRKLPSSMPDAKGAALELFKTLKDNYMPAKEGFLGIDYDYIVRSIKEASSGESFHANLLGDLKDLKSGRFADAARGLRVYLKVCNSWNEDVRCTVQGIKDEVQRLINCPDCAERQALVLDEINHKKEAQDCRRLHDALQSLKSQEARLRTLGLDVLSAGDQREDDKYEPFNQAMRRANDIREEIRDSCGWFYGCEGRSIPWPEAYVKHVYGSFKQPMCEYCRRYRLDYTKISEDLDYCLHQASSEEQCFNGVRDDGRPGMTLQDFMLTDEAREANLTDSEVASLRFYTSHSFGCINEALRNPDSTKPHPLPAIATSIQNGLKKLRSLRADDRSARETVVLWRGFRDTQSTDIFTEDGGTELAPMSTTTDVRVAVAYAVRNSKTSRSLLFRIVTDNNLQRGADLQWLSMFPGEAETLYPPLTYLQPTGRRQVVKDGAFELTVVEVKATLS